MPTLNNALRLHKNGELVRWFPERTNGEHTGGPHAMNAPLHKVKCKTHGHFGRVSFFFFACVHHVGLAYISSDLRTCTQRMVARNISALAVDSVQLWSGFQAWRVVVDGEEWLNALLWCASEGCRTAKFSFTYDAVQNSFSSMWLAARDSPAAWCKAFG